MSLLGCIWVLIASVPDLCIIFACRISEQLFSIEFVLIYSYKPAPEDQLLKAFQVLDQESKGNLSKEELTKYMTEEGTHLTIFQQFK